MDKLTDVEFEVVRNLKSGGVTFHRLIKYAEELRANRDTEIKKLKEFAQWSAELQSIADASEREGFITIDVNAFYPYFIDGFSPEDAWKEDLSHG